MDNVNCSGSENSLDDCSHNGWGSHDCDHSNDVSIDCSPPTTTVPPFTGRLYYTFTDLIVKLLTFTLSQTRHCLLRCCISRVLTVMGTVFESLQDLVFISKYQKCARVITTATSTPAPKLGSNPFVGRACGQMITYLIKYNPFLVLFCMTLIIK